MKKERLEVGQIVNTFGIKGFVKIYPYVDDISRFGNLKKVHIKSKKNDEELQIEEVKYQKNMVLVKFKGIETVENAEKLRNSFVEIDRADAIPLEEGQYFIADLLGLDVFLDTGEKLGVLEDIYNTGSSDIYVVKNELGKQFLLPYIDEVIKQINLEEGKIIVHIIEGGGVMKFDVLTLFPEMFESLNKSIIGKAVEKQIIDINLINIRDFSKDKHKKVDDTPYGGGAGMVMKADVVYDAFKSLDSKNAKVIYMSPQGKKLDQSKVVELSNEEHLIILCGHYEGIDQRVIDKIVDEEISIGDYVLTGGELPAMVLIDSVSRYKEGVLSTESIQEESFSNGMLEYPQYTRPEVFEGVKVPEVLLSRKSQRN